jgi:hypothetical protein
MGPNRQASQHPTRVTEDATPAASGLIRASVRTTLVLRMRGAAMRSRASPYTRSWMPASTTLTTRLLAALSEQGLGLGRRRCRHRWASRRGDLRAADGQLQRYRDTQDLRPWRQICSDEKRQGLPRWHAAQPRRQLSANKVITAGVNFNLTDQLLLIASYTQYRQSGLNADSRKVA